MDSQVITAFSRRTFKEYKYHLSVDKTLNKCIKEKRIPFLKIYFFVPDSNLYILYMKTPTPSKQEMKTN